MSKYYTGHFPHEAAENVMTRTFAESLRLYKLKGGEYAADNDALANFRRHAERIGVDLELIWYVYASKHWDAVTTYVQDLVHNRTRERIESLEGRIDDIITYCVLLKCILEETNNGRVNMSKGVYSKPGSPTGAGAIPAHADPSNRDPRYGAADWSTRGHDKKLADSDQPERSQS